jgi:hypothetical protein
MKAKKRYYMVEFETDVVEHYNKEIFYADSALAVLIEMKEVLGIHLLDVHIRKATWAEKRYYRKNRISACIL